MHAHMQHNQRDPCETFWNSFSVVSSSLAPQPTNSFCLSLPEPLVQSTPITESVEFCLGFFSLLCGLGNAYKQKLEESKVYLIFFPSIRDHRPTLLCAHCLKRTVLCILPNFLSFHGERQVQFGSSSMTRSRRFQDHLCMCMLQLPIFWTKQMVLKSNSRDFPGGLMVKNLPCNARNTGWIPGQKTKVPHAAGQLSPGQLLSLHARTKEKPRVPQQQSKNPTCHSQDPECHN